MDNTAVQQSFIKPVLLQGCQTAPDSKKKLPCSIWARYT